MKPSLSPYPENVLLIQLGDIGDVVLTTPTIRAVKETYPNARVSILVFKPYGSLLVADPNLYEVVEFVKFRGSFYRRLRESVAFARRLRQKHYDLVIDLRTSDRGAILSFLTGAAARIAYRGGKNPFWREILFTNILRDMKVALPPVHPGADQSLRVVREIGIDTADSTPKLYLSPNDQLRANALLAESRVSPGTKFVTINPFSRWKYKEWDNTKWGEVIDRLWEAHRIPSVLIGAQEDAAACQQIAAGRDGHVINLAGKTTLGELSALLSMSTLHIGVDSAAPHIAAAVKTSTLTIFGPGNWKSWTVADELHRVVTAEMPCIPCNQMGCDNSKKSFCLDELSTNSVYAEVNAILFSKNIPHYKLPEK